MNTTKSQIVSTYLISIFLMAGCATIPIEDSPNPEEAVVPPVTVMAEEPPNQVSNSTEAVQSDTHGDGDEATEVTKVTKANNPTETVLSDAKEGGDDATEVAKVSKVSNEPVVKKRPVTTKKARPSLSKAMATATATPVKRTSDINEADVVVPDVPIIVERTGRPDAELNYSDSVSYLVMIRPNDYLGKIAKREYSDLKKWRSIYAWNRELIGDDPNIIYPYNELKLFKPAEEISEVSHDYIVHAVTEGETLWSIAKDWYGDNLAWKLVHSDNKELFNSSGGRLSIGMELRIRTSLSDPFRNDEIMSSVGND